MANVRADDRRRPRRAPRHAAAPTPHRTAGAAGLASLLLAGLCAPAASAAGSGTVTASALPPTAAGIPQQVLPRIAPPAGMPVVTARPAAAVALPATDDLPAAYQPQVSCDPVVKPGVAAFRSLMLTTYATGVDDGVVRECEAGLSEHAEGRAWDWGLSAADPTQRAVGDSVTEWLTARGPDGSWAWNARRFGIMYIIWNGRIWATYNPSAGWRPYSGSSAHTDHIHFSFSWDGALRRTSWWTGTATTARDAGPCVAVAGQFAPPYAGPAASCPAPRPAPVAVSAAARSKPRIGPGSRGATVSAVQTGLGLPADGVFGAATASALRAWQRAHGLDASGAMDAVTWAVWLGAVPGSGTSSGEPAPSMPDPDQGTPATPAPVPAPVPARPSLSNLGWAAANDDVRALQQRLATLGWLGPGQVTGRYDAATRAAVGAFQSAQGWSGSYADGLMGPGTLARLFSSSATRGPGPVATPAPRPTPAPAPRPTPAPAPAPRPAPAPAAAPPALAHLGWGAANSDVRALQQRLVTLRWLAPSNLTGRYDASTRAAVAGFQRAQGWHGSDADGLMGPGTLRRLFAAGARPGPLAPAAGSTRPAPGTSTQARPAPRTGTTTSAARPVLSRLRLGAANADVRALQQRLTALGWLRGRASGRYDTATRAAVAAFQRAQGWGGSGADGLVGPLTLTRLYAANARHA